MAGEETRASSESRILRLLNSFPKFPSGVAWLLIILLCFPAANFILMITSGIEMEQGWQSGEWKLCGDAVLVRYFWLSWLVFLPVIPAVKVRRLRWPAMGLLTIWTFANFALPAWFMPIIEISCGPRPWL
jgi:hypothetical protein